MTATASRRMQPIPMLTEYFAGDGNPIIRYEFRPQKGWVRQSLRKRVSGAWLRRLRSEGVTHVNLSSPNKPGTLADFSVEELLASGREQRAFQRFFGVSS